MKRLYHILAFIIFISYPLISKDNNLLWSTYLGGSNFDLLACATVMSNGDIIVGYDTQSDDLPVQMSSYQKALKGDKDVYLAKFDKSGNLLWSTYFGSSGTDNIFGITIDKNDNIWIVGETGGSNFPITSDAFQKTNHGGTADAFISKLDKDGNLLYSSYIGGIAYEVLTSVALDSMNNIWAVGRTWSNDYPTTKNAIQKNINGTYDAIIVKFSIDGLCLFSSFFGGSDDDFATDISISKDKIAITGYTNSRTFPTTGIPPYQKQFNGGYDAFISIFDYNYNLIWSTEFGGWNNDYGLRCKFDYQGNIIFSGVTNSPDLKTRQGVYQENIKGGFDVFIAKFDKNYNWDWTTYYGGSLDEGYDRTYWESFYLNVDKDNSIIVNGVTKSQDLYVSPDAFQNVLKGSTDGYYFRIDSSAKMIYSSYLGGTEDDEASYSAIDNDDNLYIFGFTTSKDFPITVDAYQKTENGDWDGFITKFGNKNTETDVIVDKVTDTCESSFKIKINPKTSIRAINIIKSDNCSIKFDTLNDYFQLSVQLVDNELDGYYKFDICDYKGNIKEIEDSIPGFTIRFAPDDGAHNVHFDTTLIGNFTCLEITLYNFGSFTKTFQDIYLKNNTIFSIPQDQFPIIIKPGETKKINICYYPNEFINKLNFDTIRFQQSCIYSDYILSGFCKIIDLTSISKCGVPLVLKTKKLLNYKNSINANYDKNNGSIIIKLEISNQTHVKISLFDYMGNSVTNLLQDFLQQGNYEFNQNTLELSRGLYFLEFETDDSVSLSPLLLY